MHFCLFANIIIVTKKRKEAEKEEAEKASREKALPIARSFADVIENGTLEQARLVICSLIEKIELDDDDVKIYWKFS